MLEMTRHLQLFTGNCFQTAGYNLSMLRYSEPHETVQTYVVHVLSFFFVLHRAVKLSLCVLPCLVGTGQVGFAQKAKFYSLFVSLVLMGFDEFLNFFQLKKKKKKP